MFLLNLPPGLTLLISNLLWPRDLNSPAWTSRDFAFFFDPLLQDRALVDPNPVLVWAARNGRRETIHKIQSFTQHKQTKIDSVLKARLVMLLLCMHRSTFWIILSALSGPTSLLDFPCTPPTLHAAALGQNEAVARRLIELGADVNAVDKNGASPLTYAADNPTGTPAASPLHRAAYRGNIEAIKLLLAYGADVAARSSYNFLPWHHAAERGHYEAVVLLVEGGGDVYARTIIGWRPLDIAGNRNGGDTILFLGITGMFAQRGISGKELDGHKLSDLKVGDAARY
ncbi:hypothetical protein CNMCM8927_005287 [Aspergillus lentulus]|uniref:Uncharacterized protein n=1 Tax=Aspergillus lentulus TaxID=293939 RepID=A0AAN5YRV8_ASPLE|nr:hypothetical protein CNMCM8060_001926 [Aspergillus lentulus]KAF4197095.1 hypothetical protein CNMCM8694_003862 [Aspergillus lentulus]KAF4206180.1 hypothetical protein CNMCM8927_005287 [Aspergillus lentulus]